MKNTIETLGKIQKALKVGKNQTGNVGNKYTFKFRSAEDICEAVNQVKPDNCAVTCKTKIDYNFREVTRFSADGNTSYKTEILTGLVTVTAFFYCIEDDGKEEIITADAFAFFDASHKMSEEQKCGAAISYARKFALCNLFNIGTGEIDPDGLKEKKQPETREEKALRVKERAYTVLSKLTTQDEINAKAQQMCNDMAEFKSEILEIYNRVIAEKGAKNENQQQNA